MGAIRGGVLKKKRSTKILGLYKNTLADVRTVIVCKGVFHLSTVEAFSIHLVQLRLSRGLQAVKHANGVLLACFLQMETCRGHFDMFLLRYSIYLTHTVLFF